jgi:5-formyltetrahydrofolate cyclo-ligase
VPDPLPSKSVLRRQMRSVRRAIPDQDGKSAAIWQRLESIDRVRSARVIMAFDSIHGEPITAPFIARRRAVGQLVVLPEDVPPPDPAVIDVVVVPGTAFTERGERLGQGGGWYDRFLPGVGAGCVTIGVGFEVQILDVVPTEPHDVLLDAVVTERCVRWRDDR